MTIRQYIKKKGWSIECEKGLLCGAMSVTIGFIDGEGKEDETQMDILAYNEKELSSLFSKFCKENGFPQNTVTYIVIVQMAESMGKLT